MFSAPDALEKLQTEEELNAQLTPVLSQFCPTRTLVNSELLQWDWHSVPNRGRPNFFAVPFFYQEKPETGGTDVRNFRKPLKANGVVFRFGIPYPELLDQVYIFEGRTNYETQDVAQLFDYLNCLPTGENRGMLFDKQKFSSPSRSW